MRKLLSLIITTITLTLIFSITIKGRTLFSHVYPLISPLTITTQDAAESVFSKSYKSTTDYTRKLFHNSVPKVKDSVKSKLSSVKRGEPEEDITINEKQELDQLIKTHE